jgi:hypothetical protein
MQKRVITLINISILLIVVIALTFILLRYSILNEPETEQKEECIDVNNVASFIHSTCYDAYTKNIFMELERTQDAYSLQSITLSFFDTAQRNYTIKDIPKTNEKKTYKITTEKNPENINFILNIIKDFSAPICPNPRILFVKYCPPGSHREDVEVGIGKKRETDEDYISVGEAMREDSDILAQTLVEKERIWQSKCESQWQCEQWGACENGIQRRECTDIKECFIPTNMPDFTKFCDTKCVERWECTWSECSGGYTTPECTDLNKCGTKYNIPEKLECASDKRCQPDIECTEWTQCSSDYDFLNLIDGVKEIKGTKSRTCIDKNKCTKTEHETINCSTRVDIYTRRIRKCGQDYIAIYNKLTNEFIAKIQQSGIEEQPYLNIYLREQETEYCDYCFDGIKNGDETGVDCGGSCQSCETKQRISIYKKPSFWTKIETWFEKLIS